jgi:sugar/nucleoside kinase (ribokinase family)
MTPHEIELLVAANPVWETAWLAEELPVARYTDEGDTGSGIAVLQRSEDGGGSALNSACALAMAGHRVLVCGRVGDDPPGMAALDALRRRGVETAIEIESGRTTKRNHLFVDRRGEGAFQVFLPPLSVAPWEKEPQELLGARTLLLDRLAVNSIEWLRKRREAYLVPGGGPRSDDSGPIRINALNRNSAAGTPAVFDRFLRALPYLDYLQIPEGEIDQVPVASPVDRGDLHSPRATRITALAVIERSGIGVFVRTRGAAGVLVRELRGLDEENAQAPGGSGSMGGSAPAPPPAGPPPASRREWAIAAMPTEVVDATGAGDAFAAGFLHGLLAGKESEASARIGVDWAARACRYLGARGWLDHEPPD